MKILKIMKMKKSIVCLVLAALSVIVLFSGCGKEFSGPYADQQKAAYKLRHLKYDGYYNIVIFYENYNDSFLAGEPVLVIRPWDDTKPEKIARKIKEKFKGLDIPWLYIEGIDGTQYLDLLNDNEFKSLGIVINSLTPASDYILPLAEIDNLTRLDVRKMEYNVDKYDSLPGVKELTVADDLAWVEKCPDLEKLNVRGMTDPSKLMNIPTLKEIRTDNTPSGEAVAYALYKENPQIKTINGSDAETYNFGNGYSGRELNDYYAAVLRYEASRIDTTGFTEVEFDEIILGNKIAVAGYDAAEAITCFKDLSKYLSEESRERLASSPFDIDAVVIISTESNVIGYYTGGGNVRQLWAYAHIIDIKNKTVSTRQTIAGSLEGGLIYQKVWEELAKLFERKIP